jgi:2,4-dienoyl-CoA reductase-like NADH-dependent reductase (Old Yellow Enzyme family)
MFQNISKYNIFLFLLIFLIPNFIISKKNEKSYKTLYEPTKIGSIPVQNHFIRSATLEGLSQDGYPSPPIIDMYKKLSEGKIGLIITSYTRIAEYEQSKAGQLAIYDDKFIPSYKQMTDIIHNLGSKIVMQIVHGSSLNIYTEKPLILGPSPVVNPMTKRVPKEMTIDEIKTVIKLFAEAALRVKKSGFDGVQIHVAHGYLLSQFISPFFNKRRDEYGGSVENRVRIVREVVRAIREKVGNEYPLWVKINSWDEMEKGKGLEIEDFLKMSEMLSKDGVDVFEISGLLGYHHTKCERAYYKEGAMRLAEIIDKPVICTGGLKNRSDVEDIYLNSNVEFFGFSRGLLKNPKFIETLK